MRTRFVQIIKSLAFYNVVRNELGFEEILLSDVENHIRVFFFSKRDFVLRINLGCLSNILLAEREGLVLSKKKRLELFETVIVLNNSPLAKSDKSKRLLDLFKSYNVTLNRKVYDRFSAAKIRANHLINSILTTEGTPTGIFGSIDQPQNEIDNDHLFQIQMKEEIKRLRSENNNVQISYRPGYLYIAESPSFPNWLKIGQTLDLDQRIIAFNTYTPYSDFSFSFSHIFMDRRQAEKMIHRLFHKNRGPNGEWFHLEMSQARDGILELSKRINERLLL